MIEYSLDQLNSVKANVDSPVFTGKVTVPQGSTSNPSLAFTGDISNDTGLFLIADGQLGITCNGTQVAAFTPSNIKLIGYGNNTVVIGNGTDNGVDKLQVSGSINTATPNGYITECGGFLPIIGDTNSAYAGSAGNIATITDLNNLTRTGIYNGHDLTNAPEAGWIFVQHKQHSNPSSNAWAQQIVTTMGAGNTANHIYTRAKANGTWSQWYKIWHSGNEGSGSGLDADTVDGLHIGQSGVNYILYANASGNVGIGNNTPATKLDLGGTISSTETIRFSMGGNVAEVSSTGNGTANGLGNLSLNTRDGSAMQTRIKIVESGNILIGTTADNGVDKLQVNGSISASAINSKEFIVSKVSSNGIFDFTFSELGLGMVDNISWLLFIAIHRPTMDASNDVGNMLVVGVKPRGSGSSFSTISTLKGSGISSLTAASYNTNDLRVTTDSDTTFRCIIKVIALGGTN